MTWALALGIEGAAEHDLADDVPRLQPVLRRHHLDALRLPGERRCACSASPRRASCSSSSRSSADPDEVRPRDTRDRAEPDRRDAARRRLEARPALSFGLGVSMAAAAGAVYGVIYPFNPGSHYDLISRLLSIVVLGGLGSLGGAVFAALGMGIIESLVAVEYLADLGVVLVLRRPDRVPARPAPGDSSASASASCEPRVRARASAAASGSSASGSPSRSSSTRHGSSTSAS